MFPRLSKPVSACYTHEKFQSLLSAADMNAAAGWDREFVDGLIDRSKTYGSSMHISTLQRHHLERIATNLEKPHDAKRHR